MSSLFFVEPSFILLREATETRLFALEHMCNISYRLFCIKWNHKASPKENYHVKFCTPKFVWYAIWCYVDYFLRYPSDAAYSKLNHGHRVWYRKVTGLSGSDYICLKTGSSKILENIKRGNLW